MEEVGEEGEGVVGGGGEVGGGGRHLWKGEKTKGGTTRGDRKHNEKEGHFFGKLSDDGGMGAWGWVMGVGDGGGWGDGGGVMGVGCVRKKPKSRVKTCKTNPPSENHFFLLFPRSGGGGGVPPFASPCQS